MASPSGLQSELMNIKQAAELLGVSEISLRRWTNSGKLSCFRVGGKRERRFRKADLLAFLESQHDSAAHRSIFGEHLPRPGISLEGLEIEYGNHLCSLYETDAGRLKLSVPYLADGLRSAERCYLIASGHTRAHILETLADTFPDLPSAMETKRLVIVDGADSGADMYDYLESQFMLSTRDGIRGIRVLGDMGWALDHKVSIEDLMAFEMHYNHSLANCFPVISLCQYDARRFTGTGVLAALRNHADTFKFPLSRFVGM